jgi:hypothetical protein
MARMRQPDHRSDPAQRLWARLILAVQVLVALGLLAVALAPISAPASASPLPEAGEALLEEEADEAEEDECELEEEAFEEEGLCEEDESGSSDGDCPLRSARGHAAIAHERVKITIGYMSNEPTAVKVQIQGGAHAETFKRHLGKSGVLRFTEKLGGEHRVIVRIQPTGEPGCAPRQLTLSLPR